MSQPLAVGTVLRDRYRIVELIGRGGMGAIYRAEDVRLIGRQCAVKEVFPDLGSGVTVEQVTNQFFREASTLARLDHPNLPKVSDYFSVENREYLVMDYVPGHDLQEIMNEARRNGRFLNERQVLTWAAQLLDAVEYLHNQDPPVVHRDIKPANIKLTPRGVIKLVDFGLVKLLIPDDSRTVTVVQGRGTVAYTPLEQYGGDTGHTDVRADIYAIGATLYHLLTGEAPADAKERFLKPGSLQTPRTINSRLSSRTERCIMYAMAMHPNDRPASIGALRSELLGVGHQAVATPPIFNQPGPWQEALQANGWLLGTVVGLAFLALIISLLGLPIPAEVVASIAP